MQKLTKEQKKIIYMASGVIGFLLIFWLFIYLPSSQKLKSIKKELNLAQAKIDQVNKLVGKKELASVAIDLTKKFNNLRNKLPKKDEVIISALSQEARKLKLEIKNIAILEKVPLGQTIAGSRVEQLSVSLELVAEFKALGEYLDSLRNDFPVLVTIDKLTIGGRGEGKHSLDASLSLLAYMSKK